MAKNYVDAIPPASGRVYDITTTAEGKSQITDVTEYEQVGSTLGAADLLAGLQQEYEQNGSTLIGYGIQGRVKVLTAGTYTSFTIGGTAYTARRGAETGVELTAGTWESFLLDEEENTINFSSGGAGGLDITVLVQTEKPASPKENTILVKSDLELNTKTYKIGFEHPTTPAVNDLFFTTSNTKVNYIYADKKQQVEVSILQCEYWSGSAWLPLSFETYADGEWRLGFLIFEGINSLGAPTGNAQSVYRRDPGRFELFVGPSQNPEYTMLFPNSFDVTNADRVVLDIQALSGANNGYLNLIIVSDSGQPSKNYYYTYTNDSPNRSRRTVTIDISAMTGTAKFRVGQNDNYYSGQSGYASVAFYNIYLE